MACSEHPRETMAAPRQAFLYLQASIIGTLVNFISRFPLTEVVGFGPSVILANYLGMGTVFLLSYRRAFAMQRVDAGMLGRFILVAHIGLAVVWLVSSLMLMACKLAVPELLHAESAGRALANWLAHGPESLAMLGQPENLARLAPWIPRGFEGFSHGMGIVAGFFVNFIGHRTYSFAVGNAGSHGGQSSPDPEGAHASVLFAVLVPLAYLVLYAPYGLDTTDFGFFYGHAWRILQGEVPFRDFYYTKPPFSLYWHALWLWLTPERVSILGGKAGFFATLLASSWLGALFLGRAFDLKKLGLPLSLLATAAFVFSAHTFPAMPWHTPDGTLFGAAALFLAICGRAPLAHDGKEDGANPCGMTDLLYGLAAGLLAAAVVLVKQSFIFIPLAACLVALVYHSRWRLCGVIAGFCSGMAAFVGLMRSAGAWEAFRSQTASGFSLGEALDAGIFIYLHQNWWLPGLAVILGLASHFLFRRTGQAAPCTLTAPTRFVIWLTRPVPAYFLLLAIWYIQSAMNTPEWIGFGMSWPMLLIVLGGGLVLLPQVFLLPFAMQTSCAVRCRAPGRASAIVPAIALGAALTLAWSTGISGGYKAPAFFAAPLLLSAVLLHVFLLQREAQGAPGCRKGAEAAPLVWLMLLCGLVMFRVGAERPYIFPIRDMPRAKLTFDAGSVFPRLTGVLVDAENMELLQELKQLRATYGPNYKTLPAFPLAYLLTNDKTALSVEWLQDWEINREVDKVYQELVDRDVIVFFERSQLDTLFPDGHERTRYSVPAKVRQEWRKIEETKHFVVFRRP